MLQIPRTIYDQIRQQGEAGYPNESCAKRIPLDAKSSASITSTPITRPNLRPPTSPKPTD